MILTPSQVLRPETQQPEAPACFDCGAPTRDFGYWTANQGRIHLYRCVNRECAMCAIPKEPQEIPGLYDTRAWKTH